MPDRKSEYDPEEQPVIEPDEDPDYEPEDLPAAPSTMFASSSHPNGTGDREFEYKAEVLTLEQVTNGTTLPEMLAAESSEGWHYVEVIDGGEKRVVLFRRMKKAEKERRSVGFAPPGRS